MNLSKEELQFIDTYLKNSDVIYTDVRLELTDHVASAIEAELAENPSETFYEVFKRYMVLNKKNLLKNHEEQKAKLMDKIIIRFGKGFLAKEVLLLIVIAVLVSGFIELNFSQEILISVNLCISVIATLYYFLKFHKTKKTSVGASLMTIMLIPIYIIFYIQNPFGLFLIIPVMVIAALLYKKIERRINKERSMVFVALFTMICAPLFTLFTKWSEQFVVDDIVEGYFFFQLIMWYVLFKTLIMYKKELDTKCKEIFN